MLVVSALIAFNALLLWVATGPRSLSAVTPYIEAALSSPSKDYNVKIGDTRLLWDGWKHPVGIHLYEVFITNKDNQIITNLPEIALGVNVLYLPLGRVVPTSLIIASPTLNLLQSTDNSISLSFKQQATPETPTEISNIPFSVLLAPFLANDDSNNFGHLKRIAIQNAAVSVSKQESGVFFDASGVNIALSRERHGVIKIITSGSLTYKNYTSNLETDFSLSPKQKTISGSIQFSNLMLSELADLFSDNKDIKSIALPLSGNANVAMDLDGNVQQLDFSVWGNDGKINSEHLPAPINVGSLQAQGRLLNHLHDLEISALSADVEGVEIAASINAVGINESPAIEGDIALKNIAPEKLKTLWPESLSPETRAWVTENISGGKIPDAHLLVDIKAGDLAKPILPKEAIDANIKLDGQIIRYLPEHPSVQNVRGNVHIDGVSLLATIENGDYLENTKLSQGHVAIDDLNADNPYIKVDLHAEAPASDIVHFLGLPRLKHAQHLGLKEKEVTGKVSGDASVGFNFFTPKDKTAEDEIIYDVKASISGINQNGFLGKFDGENIDGKIAVDNKGVNFSGKGIVSGAKVSDLNVKYLFTPEKGLDTFIDLAAIADKPAIKRLGYPDFPFFSGGNVGVVANFSQGDKIERTEATLDLTDAVIDYADIGWHKGAQEKASIELTSEKKDGITSLPKFHLTGKDIEAKGALTIAPDFSSVESLFLSQFAFDGSDVQNLNYSNKNGGMIIDVTAKSLNMTAYNEKLEKEDAGFTFQNFPPTQLKANIGVLTVGKNRKIMNLNGDLNCDNICRNANLNGITNGKPFSIKIFSDKTGRKLAINAGDAGSFLHDFGVLDGMEGGVLKLNGDYKEGEKGSLLTGKLTIIEHNIKDAPLLGKLLSLASFTGFIDALAGNGIRFSELSIPFTLQNDVATLEKGKTHGSALGITVDGTITFPKKIMDLNGTIVPSYSLNSVLGNVPFIGDKLMGGEGQGLLAANYSIKGREPNAKVSVNPLSILTPGFLRGLFDVFDTPAKKTE